MSIVDGQGFHVEKDYIQQIITFDFDIIISRDVFQECSVEKMRDNPASFSIGVKDEEFFKKITRSEELQIIHTHFLIFCDLFLNLLTDLKKTLKTLLSYEDKKIITKKEFLPL